MEQRHGQRELQGSELPSPSAAVWEQTLDSVIPGLLLPAAE